jgi:hypothetical protein
MKTIFALALVAGLGLFSYYFDPNQSENATVAHSTKAPSVERQKTTPPAPAASELEQRTASPVPCDAQSRVKPNECDPVERATVAHSRPFYPDTPLPGPPAYVEPISEWFNHLVRDHGFDANYVKGLNAKQRFALHTDAHNNCVREQFVVRRVNAERATEAHSIEWVSEKEAKASPKPDWYHVTQSKNCYHCKIADTFLATPMMVAASQDFDCIKIVDPDPKGEWCRYYRITLFPSDRFTAPGRQTWVINGRVDSTADYLGQLNMALKHLKGAKLPTVGALPKNVVKNGLIPTLAAKLPTRTPEAVEGKQHSVLSPRGGDRTSYAPRAAPLPARSTPGPIRRARFAPGPRF